MILKNLRKLFPFRTDHFKCDVRNFMRIAEANLKTTVGKHSKVKGWVRALRNMKGTVFIDISDGSCTEPLQIVIQKSAVPSALSYGSSVTVEGEFATAPNGRLELHASDISVIGACVVTDGYPFVPRTQYSTDYIRQFLHLRPRTRGFSSLLRLRDLASTAIRDHLRNRNFINIHTPILTSNDCEGAGEIFSVRPGSEEILKSMKKEGLSDDEAYFNSKVYLTVSGQLHLEAVARSLTKVYTFGPTFRAENSRSRLHLSEFYMIEAEVAFVNEIEDITKEAESLVKETTRVLIETGASDLRSIGAPEPLWLDEKFGYLTYDEAINILEKHIDRLTFPIKYGDGLSKEHEMFLVQHNKGVPVFIVNWPKQSKPFYMKECPTDPSKVVAVDLLVPQVGELIGGSLREDDYDKLKLKLPSTKNLAWYLELRKYGNVTTGGFGMGFERFLQSILGINNIKDTIPFPRWPHNCSL